MKLSFEGLWVVFNGSHQNRLYYVDMILYKRPLSFGICSAVTGVTPSLWLCSLPSSCWGFSPVSWYYSSRPHWSTMLSSFQLPSSENHFRNSYGTTPNCLDPESHFSTSTFPASSPGTSPTSKFPTLSRSPLIGTMKQPAFSMDSWNTRRTSRWPWQAVLVPIDLR